MKRFFVSCILFLTAAGWAANSSGWCSNITLDDATGSKPCGAAIQSRPGTPASLDFAISPNPFNGGKTLTFTVTGVRPIGREGGISVYNLSGRLVASLPLNRSGGVSSIRWDGRGRDGMALSSGLYIARLQLGSQSIDKNVLLVK